MRTRTFALALFATILTANTVSAGVFDEVIIDEKFKEAEEAFEKEQVEVCFRKKAPVPVQLKCARELRDEYEAKGLFRGTDEFCRRNYLDLSVKELRKKDRELSDLQSKAREPAYSDPGELTFYILGNERSCIAEILSKKHGVRTY